MAAVVVFTKTESNGHSTEYVTAILHHSSNNSLVHGFQLVDR